MLYKMIDISSNNPPPDLDELWAEGYRVLGIKCTESTNYHFTNGEVLGAKWHAKGGIVVWYHFLHPDKGAEQATYFWSFYKKVRKVGDLIAVDVEVNGAWNSYKAFIDETRRRTRDRGLIYGSPGYLEPHGVIKYKGWRLWLAQYGSHANVPRSWKYWMLWQYTSSGHDKADSGRIDISYVKDWVFQPNLSMGDRNICVYMLKRNLKELGYKGISNSQRYGPATKRAVNKVRAKHHMGQTGRVDQRVWRHIEGKKV
jgi:GH25 family lysozyme M1 (1,4-beta-N-acetylmuramidase)